MALTHHDTRHSSMKRIWGSCYSIFSFMCMLCRLLSVRFLLAHRWCCLSFFFWPICGVVCPSSFGPSVVLFVLFLLFHLWCCLSFFFCSICGVVCPFSMGPSVVWSVLLLLAHLWCCLSVDLRTLITPLVSSNSSSKTY